MEMEAEMVPNIIRMVTVLWVLVFLGNVAFGAGSSSMPAGDQRPGVAHYNEGVAAMQKERYAKAQAKFESALARNPDMAEAHNNLGYALRKQGPENFDAALRHYNRAIQLNSELAEAYMYRGVLYMLMGQEELALQDHRTLTGLNRRLADALQAAIASGEEPEGLEGLATSW